MRPISRLLILKIVLYYVLAVICAAGALATTINLGFILTQDNSVSVINVLIGQFVMIVALLVLGKWLYEKGREGRQHRRQSL